MVRWLSVAKNPDNSWIVERLGGALPQNGWVFSNPIKSVTILFGASGVNGRDYIRNRCLTAFTDERRLKFGAGLGTTLLVRSHRVHSFHLFILVVLRWFFNSFNLAFLFSALVNVCFPFFLGLHLDGLLFLLLAF